MVSPRVLYTRHGKVLLQCILTIVMIYVTNTRQAIISIYLVRESCLVLKYYMIIMSWVVTPCFVFFLSGGEEVHESPPRLHPPLPIFELKF